MIVFYQHREAIALAVITLAAAAVWGTVAWLLIQRRRERLETAAWRAHKTIQTPVDGPHEGANEAYGAELQQVGQTLPSAELRTTGEQMVADHQELAGIGVAIDQFDEAVEHALRLFTSSLSGRDQLHVSRVSTTTNSDTGTFNRRELDAMLAQQPALTDAEVAEIHAEALAGAQ